jgi:hypothetical protein
VVHPCPEAGIAGLQEENQRDLQARIQEADLVGEQAYLLKESESSFKSYIFCTYAYQVGNWACPADLRILAADLVGEAACL